ncbi:MAG: ABC transporter permease [Clostridia bacterium]|nr:ABC transporter permease [Clostridia bacterium]
MKNLFTVMKFTMREMVRKKSFIISTIIIIALIIGGFSLPKILSAINEEKGNKKILISDESNVFEGTLESLKTMDLPYDITINKTSYDDIKNKIENKEIETAFIIEKENEQVKIKYVVENIRWENEVPQDLFGAMSSIYSNLQISKLGITPEQLQMITPNFETSVEQTQKDEVEFQNVFVMMAVSFSLSMAIILFTVQVAQSITTEKTSKIMETLVTSTSPRTIVLGKTIGIGLIGLMQVILFITTAIICANVFLDSELINMLLNVSNITPGFIIITLVYFVLGYFAYALLYALTGSLVTKPEDIQSANTPVSMIAMIGFYLGYFSISIDPTSSVAAFAGMFPISSAFCMPARIMMGLATPQDIAISIVLLIVMVAIIAKIAISVYSNAILNYGSKMSLKDALRLCKEKKK